MCVDSHLHKTWVFPRHWQKKNTINNERAEDRVTTLRVSNPCLTFPLKRTLPYLEIKRYTLGCSLWSERGGRLSRAFFGAWKTSDFIPLIQPGSQICCTMGGWILPLPLTKQGSSFSSSLLLRAKNGGWPQRCPRCSHLVLFVQT